MIAKAACSVLNCKEQGGARWTIGGSLDVISGGDLDIESGGAWKIAGTQVTATAAELNSLSGTSAIVPSTLSTNAVGAANSIWGITNGLSFEGSVADDFETIVTVANPSIDRTFTIPNIDGTALVSTILGSGPNFASGVWAQGNSKIIMEGSTADEFETTIEPTDPTEDNLLTIANGSTGTIMVSTLATNAPDLANSVWGVSGGIAFEGSGATTQETTLTVTNPATVDRTATLPDATGTVVLTGNITVSDQANQACSTTCSNTCIIGLDGATPAFVACSDATADSCLCLTTD
jgi:hypothetical protein